MNNEAASHAHAHAMTAALEEARKFVGATAPNPPVGAAAIDESGRLLAVAAHERAGTEHAEAKLLRICRERGLLSKIHTLFVTLEPCNHHGRTPPCTEAIIAAGVRRVIFGSVDPNPAVLGGGEARLREAGIEVSSGFQQTECNELIRAFRQRVSKGFPWVTIKTAWTADGSMLPPPGTKTFTSPDSLRLAHELRKRADAILTGSGTVLADQPEFTVRHVADHPGKTRWIVVMDRRDRVPENWIRLAESRGFVVVRHREIPTALRFLADQGCMEVLVEAGPTLSSAILDQGLWNEHVRITARRDGQGDTVEKFRALG